MIINVKHYFFCAVSLADLNYSKGIKIRIESEKNPVGPRFCWKNRLFTVAYIHVLYMETIHSLAVCRQTSNKLVAGISFRTTAGKFTLWSIPVCQTGVFTIDSKSNAF